MRNAQIESDPESRRRRHDLRSPSQGFRRLQRQQAGQCHESRKRQTEREIERFVALSGGRITDDIEREMMTRVLTSNWGARE